MQTQPQDEASDGILALPYERHPELAATIRAGAMAERDLRNEIAGRADVADALADRLVNLANRSRELAGELRSAAVAA